MMQWTQSNAIGLAKTSCVYCSGVGTREIREGVTVPCNCIFRAIFRACYNRFKECAALGSHTGSVSMEYWSALDGRRSYSRQREDYMADFCLVSQRSLSYDEYKLFRYHFLLGADYKLCCRQLKMDRGYFFHTLYRIEQRLGRTFAELEPYALFPLDEYFRSTVRKGPSRSDVADPRRPWRREEGVLALSA
jgi:hypothetical protein